MLENKSRIFIFCPDNNEPSGGVKLLYRYVDTLNRNGCESYILHVKKGFRCTWFQNNTKVCYKNIFKEREDSSRWILTIVRFLAGPFWNPFYLLKNVVKLFVRKKYRTDTLDGIRAWKRESFEALRSKEAQLKPSDYLVIPEIYGPDIGGIEPSVKKVILNQNAHYTFWRYPLIGEAPATPYVNRSIVQTAVISDHSYQYLREIFPRLEMTRLRYGFDSKIFQYIRTKKRQIAFMSRKLPNHCLQLVNILKYRGNLDGFQFVDICNCSEKETAKILGESLIFLSFSDQEGCPMPPGEAMACGCIVVGYDGGGGKEYFDTNFCYPIVYGDLIGYAKTVEDIILRYRKDSNAVLDMGKKASEYITSHYSLAQEERDILAFWRKIISSQASAEK